MSWLLQLLTNTEQQTGGLDNQENADVDVHDRHTNTQATFTVHNNDGVTEITPKPYDQNAARMAKEEKGSTPNRRSSSNLKIN